MLFLSSIPVWGWLDILFTMMVLIGVCGESDWAARLLVSDSSNNLTPVEHKRAKVKKMFETILIIGIAGELICLPFSLLESAEFNKEAAEARKYAGAAIEHAANTESNNLVLQAKVLELQNRMQPRTISLKQISNFIFLAEKIQKIPISIHVSPEGDDTLQFAYQLRAMLDKAGFQRDSEPNGAKMDSGSVSFFTKPPGESNEWPTVVFVAYGTERVVYLDRALPYELTNGFTRPIVSEPIPRKIYEAIETCLQQIGMKTDWTANSNWMSPGQFEIYVLPKFN